MFKWFSSIGLEEEKFRRNVYLLYGDLSKQPSFINNPIGTSINHFFYFFYLAIPRISL